MPKRTDLHKILVIGAGPIVIGQGCEFDYSGSQAVKALKEEGYEVVLVNSNPATIMTDPHMADATYIEPIEQQTLAAIIRKERPDALLPTLGGQTALNAALGLAKSGVLAECGVELIGARAEVIEKAESRELFRQAMENIGLKVPASGIAHNMDEVRALGDVLPFPLIIRPAFTLGGTGGGIAYNMADLEEVAGHGLSASPVSEVMIEQSVLGWKEFEMEVMRDKNDNCVIVCSIENVDAMGVHTGDSITVAPAQTLTDAEYQMMRDASFAIMREIGVETGGSNVQFGINPANGEMVVIEMNPRVSRSSALASKATGFPIAKLAAKLAIGYTLDELRNDITRETAASFEPAIDYCVVKIPRFTFEKFPGAKDELTTSMKSVGEAMSIGRTFKEALQKGLRSMEIGASGLGFNFRRELPPLPEIMAGLRKPHSRRIFTLRQALLAGVSVEDIHEASGIDPWFIRQMRDIVDMETRIRDFGLANDMTPLNPELPEILREAKEYGFSDRQLSEMWKRPETDIRRLRKEMGIVPTFYLVDTCAAEFEAYTPYYYSTYEKGDEVQTKDCRKVLILGGGPNRIGQGIEFDYCCVHACYELAERGFETIMVNCNPETVSTDYDTSDRLYFEPVTYEDVMDIVDAERPVGVITTLGGQTPVNLTRALAESGVKIMGTQPDAIDFAEDRERFSALLDRLGIMYPPAGMATSFEEAEAVAAQIGYPLLVRPSYVLGGRGMMIAYDAERLREYMAEATRVSPDHPIYLDRFLEGAYESDVDALCDGENVYIGGILEHIEEAGIHSGDSATCIPPFSFSESLQEKLRETTRRIALALGVRGLVNVQYAVKGDAIYVIEANPRASRTVPFISKATGVPLARCAARIMAGAALSDLDLPDDRRKLDYFCMKEAVMPWGRFPGAEVILGPEMKSTGEVMGIAKSYPEAYAKTQLAIDYQLPTPKDGRVFISVCDRDKRHILSLARILRYLGFEIVSTEGTARVLRGGNVPCEIVGKVGASSSEDGGSSILDLIAGGEIAFIVNIPYGPGSRGDGYLLRTEAVRRGVTCVTAMSAANTYVSAIEAVREDQQGHGSANDMGMDVIALQDLPQHTV